jgi:hypothetical protein
MTLEEIDTLIAGLADNYELPLSGAARKELERIRDASNIPLRECWEAADKLNFAACWEALTQLRKRA